MGCCDTQSQDTTYNEVSVMPGKENRSNNSISKMTDSKELKTTIIQ